MVKIAVLGYGTIGSGVVEVVERNRDVLTKKAGEEISVKYILDLRDFPEIPTSRRLCTITGSSKMTRRSALW